MLPRTPLFWGAKAPQRPLGWRGKPDTCVARWGHGARRKASTRSHVRRSWAHCQPIPHNSMRRSLPTLLSPTRPHIIPPPPSAPAPPPAPPSPTPPHLPPILPERSLTTWLPPETNVSFLLPLGSLPAAASAPIKASLRVPTFPDTPARQNRCFPTGERWHLHSPAPPSARTSRSTPLRAHLGVLQIQGGEGPVDAQRVGQGLRALVTHLPEGSPCSLPHPASSPHERGWCRVANASTVTTPTKNPFQMWG